MPAFRGINLRSGDLAEQMGLLLLQNLALVAPVPRTEDVGVDAVVTLLKRFDATRLIASSSFFVQIKSSSVESIEFKGHEVGWLYSLELPFFVASVDRSDNTISLFCCHRLSDAFITKHDREQITIHLSTEPAIDEDGPDEVVAPESDDVYVGPPILEWSIEDANNVDFVETFYEVCQAHIVIFREGLEMRRVGQSPSLVWRINSVPQRTGFVATSSHPKGTQIGKFADIAMPYVVRLLMESMRAGDVYWVKELKKLADGCLRTINRLNETTSTPTVAETGSVARDDDSQVTAISSGEKDEPPSESHEG